MLLPTPNVMRRKYLPCADVAAVAVVVPLPRKAVAPAQQSCKTESRLLECQASLSIASAKKNKMTLIVPNYGTYQLSY
jgi:hypothetical protein